MPPSSQASLSELRDAYRADKATQLVELANSGMDTRGVAPALRNLAELADDLLIELFKRAGLGSPLALAAVGGFGRGELFPYSDVDVLLLLPDGMDLGQDPARQASIEAFIGSCWDAGLEIGSSVRTLGECLSEAAADVTIQTALLESRLITGDKALFKDFQNRFSAAMDPRQFFTAKTMEMRQRHSRFEDTPYALEPNCKESPGGLRDLQIILWVAKAAGLGKNWTEIGQAGLATPFEIKQLRSNEAMLRLIRARLHLAAKRREDRLVFDLQTSVAQTFGYTLPPEGQPRGAVRPSERLMRQYYWAAKAVAQLNQILLLNIEERLNPIRHTLRPLGEDFYDKSGMVEVASDDLYQRKPHAILETFLIYQTNEGLKGLSARTLRALYNARNLMDGSFRKDAQNHATFRKILMQSRGLTHAMRLMNQTSVLGRYLWAFRKIVGQMQHDLFHVYTVDQHILMVLRNVRRYFIAEHAHEYPLCSQLASGWDRPWVLYVAALYHDIAKGRGGDHSVLGEVEVKRFARTHGFNKDDSALMAFLVREHLTMSHVAQKLDLSDPDVIANFAKRVGNEQRLTALYLFTVADIRGTSPKVWNAWKGKLLEDLYRATSRALGGHTPDVHAEVQERQRRALVELALHSQRFEAHKPFWATLDVSYFMRHDASEIAWHTRQLARHLGSQQALVRARRSPLGEGLQVLVYTPDRPDLFARICGYFDHSDFSILDARIHTTLNGYALDTFQVIAPHLREHHRELINMIEVELGRSLNEGGDLRPPSKGRVSRRVKSFPVTPRVSLKPDEKGQRWLLNVSASDRAGLLYCIALVLAKYKIDLQLAKIATLGERVEDTFVIQGSALQSSRSQIAIETELIEALR
jgi:[protein-PII] uridylyltransferase